MTTLTVKCGRVELELNSKDEIMYNGACYQVMTRKVGYGWNISIPILAKAKAGKLIKAGELVLDRIEKQYGSVEIYKIKCGP